MREIRKVLETYARSFHQSIDISAAVLLLTGQMSIRSVVFSTGAEIRLSLSGPLTSGTRVVPRTDEPAAPIVMNTTNAIVALLLILGEIQTVGIFVQSKRFGLLVAGPPLGSPRTVAYVPGTCRFFEKFKWQVLKQYRVKQTNKGGE